MTVVALINTDKKRHVNLNTEIPGYNPTQSLAYRMQLKNKTEGLSEYQAAYRKYPFQKPRQCVRPMQNRVENNGAKLMTTTYRKDFVCHEGQEGFKMESFKPLLSYKPPSSKFVGQTIYSMSYQNFDKETVQHCRPALIKPGETPKAQFISLPVKPTSTGDNQVKNDTETESQTKTTHSDNQAVTDTQPETETEATIEPPQIDPPDASGKILVTTKHAGSKSKIQYAPFNGITTFMADFPRHAYVPRLPLCKPPSSNNHYDVGPFDGRTTQNMAYKVWPVVPPEKPTWAIKPEYIRPSGGMPFDSTYTVDFHDPGSIVAKASPIKPQVGRDIIKHEAGDADKSITTYQGNFQEWTGARPAQTFHQKQYYVPPTGDMDCCSIHQLHFRGVQTERVKPCQKISQHRDLNDNKQMYFNTTYRDTYYARTLGRPKSCPAAISVVKAAEKLTSPRSD